MSMCRTCLKTPADKNVYQLENFIKNCNKTCFEIMLFCLDIEVTQDSGITTNLCSTCFRKIVLIYKFKALSLKNNSYLNSLDPVMVMEDQKLSVYVDESGIKHENYLDVDEFPSPFVENCGVDIKIEVDVKDDLLDDVEHCLIDEKNEDVFQNTQSDEEPLSVVRKVKCEDIKENAPKHNKQGIPKKVELQKNGKLNQERQVCEECGKAVRNIKEHALQHRPVEDLAVQCRACHKYFINKSKERRHYKSVHVQKRRQKLKCDICNKEVRDLKTHTMMVHNRASLPHGCALCGRRYLSRSALAVHMTTHTNHLPFECDECQRKFRSKFQVSNHIREIHQKEKNFQCEFCSKSFFAKGAFDQHSRTHAKERLHKCEVCGLALKTRETLSKHRAVHGGVKRFHCDLCTKSFRISSSLKSHMLTHTKEKPFQCRYCDARFRRDHHLKRHERSLHNKLAE